MGTRSNYYMEVMPKVKYAGCNVVPESFCHFYQLTKQEVIKIAQGIAIGLRCRYKAPIVRVYEVNCEGGYVFLYDQK